MNRINLFIFCILAFFAVFLSCTNNPTPQRHVVSLDGEWMIAKTDRTIPDAYTSTIPVPGLVDLVVPALLTEYWRAHRRAIGILHFCGLAYSHPDEQRGQTSDNFTDIKNLTFQPEFYKYSDKINKFF